MNCGLAPKLVREALPKLKPPEVSNACEILEGNCFKMETFV